MAQIPELMSGRALEHGITMMLDHGGTSSAKMHVGGQVQCDVAAGQTTVSSTVENACSNFEIPANTLVAGSTIRVRFLVYVLDQNGSDTLQVGIRLGSDTTARNNTGMLSAATDVADTDALVGECTFVVRTAGSSGTVMGFGTIATGTAGSKLSVATDQTGAFTATALDTTVVNYLNVTTKWSGSSADNEATTEAVVIDIVNPST